MNTYTIMSGSYFTFSAYTDSTFDFGPYASPQLFTGPGDVNVTVNLPPSETIYDLNVTAIQLYNVRMISLIVSDFRFSRAAILSL